MLRIGRPFIRHRGDKVRLCAKLEFPDAERLAWFETDKEYEKYLTADRADAFVAAFLTPAMKAGEDIVSEAPVTKRLLYQLNRQLIPTLSQRMKRYHVMQIRAEGTEEILSCEDAVGLGWTGGVDCFYSFKRYAEADEPAMKVTHLVVLNIGTFEEGDLEEDLSVFLRRAHDMAKEQGIQAMGINSNIHCIVQENYLSVGAFRIASAILALQKLFGVFLHSSSYEYWRFALREENCAFYELFVLDCLETDQTRFYSSMGDASRIEKISALTEYPPAWTRLHPCLHPQDKNCGRCGKCERVFTTLYALGELERFAETTDTGQIRESLEEFKEDIALHANGIYNGELLKLLDERGMLTLRQKRLSRVAKAARALERR